MDVRCKVKNHGTGKATLDVAAVKGERFVKQSEEEARQGPPGVTPEWREARQSIVLAAGEEKDVEIPCDFEPDQVLVDPDAMVLQLNRKSALWEF